MAPAQKAGVQELWPRSWLVPDWPAPAGVHALCTTREGGVSQAPWNSMNLGAHVGDLPGHVRCNRARLASAIARGTAGARTAYLQQVHGVDVLQLSAANVMQADGAAFDACVTSDAGVVCTIMVADCLPVLLAHRSGLVVGAAHAGWRGLAGMPPGRLPPQGPLRSGVLETLFAQFCAQARIACAQAAGEAEDSEAIASQTMAWLGPCIGPDAFEVGPEVRAAFMAHDGDARQCFRPAPHGEQGAAPRKYLADLPQLARRRLHALGIDAVYGNDGSASWCTVGNASRFFSHRRDAVRLGGSGRFAACIWRDAGTAAI